MGWDGSQILATYGNLAGLLWDCGVCGETPGSSQTVVWVPAEVLLEDAVWLGSVELPTGEQGGKTKAASSEEA